MTLDQFARTRPRLFDWGIRLDRAPAAAWLALQAAALTPTWLWMARRLLDRADDPLGLLALGALALFAWSMRRSLRAAPRLGWLAIAAAGTLAATLLRTGIGPMPACPPLAAGLMAVLALAAGLLAFLPRPVAKLPVLGLAVLGLPLLSSLQFYAGFPLRVITAEASRWLLAPGFSVLREGSSLLVEGRLIVVDAPCSGVQMAWLGYFTACAVALWARHGDRRFLTRLPAVGLLVLVGNILRNCVLVGFDGAGHALAPWLHEALGLAVLALVCGAIAQLMAPARRAASFIPTAVPGLITAPGAAVSIPLYLERCFGNRFLNRVAHKAAFALAMALCLLWSAASTLRTPIRSAPVTSFQEWPSEWDGAPLRPMALGTVERRFAERFPGAIARLTDGVQTVVLRQVNAPTRMLHPAADCYKALGFPIGETRLERDPQDRLWRCFVTEGPDGRKLRVCERIVDAEGAAFTDTSAWYWAAAGGRSKGPWQAVTLARPLRSSD